MSTRTISIARTTTNRPIGSYVTITIRDGKSRTVGYLTLEDLARIITGVSEVHFCKDPDDLPAHQGSPNERERGRRGGMRSGPPESLGRKQNSPTGPDR